MNVIKPEIGVSVLAEDQRPLTDQFAGRKTEGAQFRFVNRAGTPLVDGAAAHFVVRFVDAHLAGAHT
jgi:hypothetical protein